jgi:hypothetical protein
MKLDLFPNLTFQIRKDEPKNENGK